MISLNNIDRFVWDYWYFFDPNTTIFHVFFLNAERFLKTKEEHHFSSEVGYAKTRDFISYNWIDSSILSANKNEWFDTSIWTGDVVKVRNGFLMFFTSRDSSKNDGLTQNIGVAYSDNIESSLWTPIPEFRLRPAPNYYTQKSNPDDVSIHAWRDPYLFLFNGIPHMLISAKTKDGKLGRNGCIALLRSINNSLLDWEALPPLYSPGYYSEMEVSQLLIDKTDSYHLIFSSPPKWDFAPTTSHAGGLHSIILGQSLEDSFGEKPKVLLPFSSNLYACRIIPELDGEIVGFDPENGGLRKSGVKTKLNHVDRDFSKFKFN